MDRESSGRPLFKNLKYCVRCCIPETQEGIQFDEMGICLACQSSEEKIHISWVEREQELRRIFAEAKRKSGNNYDCIVPISGGKDSVFQMHVLTKVYDMKPLAVTWSHNWFSETGWYNLQNALEVFNIDHIMFTPNRDLVNRLAKKSLYGTGDSCWHCHSGMGTFPLQIAVKFNIPLLVWGEPLSEGSGRTTYKSQVIKFDQDYFTKVSAKLKPEEMVCDYLSKKDLHPFNLVSSEEVEKVGAYGIYLGNYLFWDDERQMEFIRDTYGWKETQMEGSYKRYKSAECIMPGVHDSTCYLKRGFSRASTHASMDIRAGLLTREEGFELANKHDAERPEALDYYLKITGMTEEEYYKVMKSHRKEQLKDEEIPIYPKEKPNEEKILPYTQQLIQKIRGNDNNQ